MTEQEKRSYNREHYLKNRNVILGKAKVRYKSKNPPQSNVVSLFKSSADEISTPLPPKPPKPTKPKSKRFNKLDLFLKILVAAMTYFLITEAAKFYAATDGSLSIGYLKALILEGAIFAFSFMKGTPGPVKFFYKAMTFLIFTYSIWVLSGSAIHSALLQQNQVSFHEKITHELEKEIATQTLLRDSFFQKNRITLAMKLDQKLNELKLRLETSRRVLSQSPASAVIWNTLLSLVVFRILVMLSNILCLNELGRRYKLKAKFV